MIDKEKLKKAQEWADQASEMAKYSPTMPERAKAAAEVIESLPSTVVDGEKLRDVIDRHVFDMEEDTVGDLEALLPYPPAPRTMAEIEWDDAEHHLAEASVAVDTLDGNISDTVIMLGVNRFGNISALDTSTWAAWALSKDTLTPTDRKYRLEPSESVPKGGPIETGDDHASHCASCAEMDEDEQEFDPAYTYRDGDGDVWEHLDGRWISGHTHAERVATREAILGIASLPKAFGPYTRVEKKKATEQEFDPAYTYSDRQGDKWEWREDKDSDHLGEWVCYHRLDEDELTWEPIPPAVYGPYEEANE